MHAPTRHSGVHPCAPAAPRFPRYTGAPTKPCGGTAFTIDALLAKPEDRGLKHRQQTPPLPGGSLVPLVLRGLQGPSAAYLFPPGVLHPAAAHPPPPRCSAYCCAPFAFPQPAASCRGGFYAPDSPSKGHGVHSFKMKGGKSKRMRTSFTNEQLSRLEKEFARQQYMVGSERFLLASALQLTEAQVKVWFQNRRIKWRKQSLEQQQAKLAKLGLAAPPPPRASSPGSQGHGDEEDDFSGSSDADIDVSEDYIDHC